MEEEGIEAVLAKAIDLRLKVMNCIQRATNNTTNDSKSLSFEEKEGLEQNAVDAKKADNSAKFLDGGEGLSTEEDEEAVRLLLIRDALESLELQLSNLQDLQQQQRYEKEVALSEIERSRKILLDKLKEYKGEDLEVIRETSVFAGETVEHKNDFLLPPCPSRPPQSLVFDNRHLSHFHSSRKPIQNGVTAGNHSEINKAQPISKNSSKGLGHVLGAAAKTVVTLVGVLSVLSMSGFGPKVGKGNNALKILGLFMQPATEENGKTEGCSPGRVLVMEDGEARCVVKERVAIPFESVVAKPDVNYGSG